MKGLTLENIAKACGGKLFLINGDDAEKEARAIIIDSRKFTEGCVFTATKGERVDGHSFIPDMWEKGALTVICEDVPAEIKGNYILVESSFQALKDIAEFYRMQLKVKIVGVTGSVGKTSTKEMIASVLSVKFNTQKTAGNFNNEVGVPLTIFSIDESHETAVVEMGISDFGEMTRLSKIVKPDISVITNVGPCHLECLKDLDGVLKAKTEIFINMNPGGTVILNGDDDKLKTVRNVHNKAPINFGRSETNDVYAVNVVNRGLLGTDCRICTGRGSFDVRIPLPGEHHVLNALAASAAGLSLGMSIDEIKRGIEAVEATKGRGRVVETDKYVILDDCYNANPKSMKSGLDLLSIAEGIKVSIVGDMFELGENEEALHGEVGAYISDANTDLLICIGRLAANIYDRADINGKKVYFEQLEDAMPQLESILDSVYDGKNKPAVFVKASHGMHFEKIVDMLTGCS